MNSLDIMNDIQRIYGKLVDNMIFDKNFCFENLVIDKMKIVS